MARDASGNYFLPSGNPVVGGQPIAAAWANGTMNDLALALSDSLSRSGKGGMGAPLVMNGYRVVAIGLATNAADAPQAAQVRDTVFNRLANVVSDSGGNNYTATALINTPPVDGTTYLFVADKDNSGPMTLSVNGSAASDISINGVPTPPKIVVAGAVIGVIFLAGTWRVTNTAGAVGTINTVQSDNVDMISVTNNTSLAVATLNLHPNVPRGLAQLDSNAKLPVAQMPFTTLQFIGNWNAGPGINPPDAANGQVYLIVGAGTLTLYRFNAGTNNYTPQATPCSINDQILYKTPDSPGQPHGWYYSPAPSGTATAANVSMTPTSTAIGNPFKDIANVQTWLNVADPQINGKLNLTGGTMAGEILQPAAPSTDQALANRAYVLAQIALIPPNVSSFNTRTGPVTLLPADIDSALGFHPANAATQAFTGPISATTGTFSGAVTAKAFVQQTPTPVAATAIIDFVNGQTQIFTLSAPLAVTDINNVPVGSILRLVFINTNFALTFTDPDVAWPLGAAPNLALGSLKKAIVVLTNDGTKLLATSSAY
jgi:hypothetical protein